MLYTIGHVTAQRAAFKLDHMPGARLLSLAEHCDCAAPLATLAINARDSLALAAACRLVLAERRP